MKKEYSKVLKAEFAKWLKVNAPQYEDFKGKSIYLFPGEKAYVYKVKDSLWCFIVLSPQANGEDAFTIELGWSAQQRFPEIGMRPSFQPSESRAEFNEYEAFTRLPYLYRGEEFWSIGKPLGIFDTSVNALEKKNESPVTEEIKSDVLLALSNACQCLVEYGLVYLEELTQKR